MNKREQELLKGYKQRIQDLLLPEWKSLTHQEKKRMRAYSHRMLKMIQLGLQIQELQISAIQQIFLEKD